jgi:hypothetical protein
LQVLYTVRRERLRMAHLDDNLLCRWRVGFNMEDLVWDAATFSKDHARWLAGDGTLIGAGVGPKSCTRKATRPPRRRMIRATPASTSTASDVVSQRKWQGVEEIFGWMKTVGLLRKTRHRGMTRVGWMFTFAAAVYNLVRLRTLAALA